MSIYFVKEPKSVVLSGERKTNYAYHLAELIPFSGGGEISTAVPIDTVKYPAGDLYRGGERSNNIWTLDWGTPWFDDQWGNGQHELVDQFGKRFNITDNTDHQLTISIPSDPPENGRAFISPTRLYLNSTNGFSSGGSYAFIPGSRITKAIAIEPISSTKVQVYGVGGLSPNAWRANQFNVNTTAGGFSKFLLIDSERNLFKITKTETPAENWDSTEYFATLTLDAAPGITKAPAPGAALILDSTGYVEYNGRSSNSKGQYLKDVEVFGSFVQGNSTIIGSPFESRKERGETMEINWLGATTNSSLAGTRVSMSSRFKMVLNDGSASPWAGDFVDTTSSNVVLITDPTPQDVTIVEPHDLEGWEDDLNDEVSTNVEVRYQFKLKNDYDAGTPVAAYLWWAVPVNYNLDIEITFSDDDNKEPMWIPEYNANYHIFLQVVAVNGAKSNAVQITETPIVITGRDDPFDDWGDPTIDVINFDDYNRAIGTLASFNFDGDPEDLLNIDEYGNRGGTDGIAINFSTGIAAFNDVIVRGTIYATYGSIGGWLIDSQRIYDDDNYIELHSTNKYFKVNDGSNDRVILGLVDTSPDKFGFRANDINGNELIGLYGTTANILGWTATTTALYKDTGTELTSSGMSPPDYPFYSGSQYASRATAPFRVNIAGEMWGTAGNIGGSFWVGSTSNRIHLDGANHYIESENYQSGNQGYRITGLGYAEFQDAFVRGNFTAQSMTIQEMQVTRGTALITKSAGDLYEAITNPGNPFTIKISKTSSTASGYPFAINDILQVVDGTTKLWGTVTSRSDPGDYYSYTCTRNNTPASHTYPQGTVVADYGVSTDGGIKLTADDPGGYSPYIDIFENTATPWVSITTIGRLGRIDGIGGMGYAAGTKGFFFGSSGGDHITYRSDTSRLELTGDIFINNPENQDNIKVFYAATPPTAIHVGDLWFDTSTSFDVLHSATSINPTVWEVVDRDAIRTFYAPDTNIPTSVHIGDLWYATNDNNRLYVAASVGCSTIGDGLWEGVDSPSITTWYQSGIPTANRAGDLWYETDNDDQLWVARSAGANDKAPGEWEISQYDQLDYAGDHASWGTDTIAGLAVPLYEFNSGADGLQITGAGLGYIYDGTLRSYIGNQGNLYLGNSSGKNALAYISSSSLLYMAGDDVEEENRILVSAVDHNMLFQTWSGSTWVTKIRIDDDVFDGGAEQPGIRVNEGIFHAVHTSNSSIPGIHSEMYAQTGYKGATGGVIGTGGSGTIEDFNTALVGVKGNATVKAGSYLSRGVQGYGYTSMASTTTVGLYGRSTTASASATGYGVYGTADGTGTNYAGYFVGNVHSTTAITSPSVTATTSFTLGSDYTTDRKFYFGGVDYYMLFNYYSSTERAIEFGSTNASTKRLGVKMQGSLAVGSTLYANKDVDGEIRAKDDIISYYSDQRLKDVIGVIKDPIEKISMLSGIYYKENKFAEQFGFRNKIQKVGILAQEVQKVLPEAVSLAPFDMKSDGTSQSGENYLTIQYEKIIPLLIEGMKAQQKEIEDLKRRIEA